MMRDEVENAVAKPQHVVWDMDSCEIPDGCDPCEIRWILESALVKRYGPGPLTIFATGNLKRVPSHVLEAISRSGIIISHNIIGSRIVVNHLFDWVEEHPAPAILMLIAEFRPVNEKCFVMFESMGFTMARAYLNPHPESPKYISSVWLWKSLLTDTKQETTTRQVLQEDYNETAWHCRHCYVDGQGFEDFTSHLYGEDHTLRELLFLPHNYFMKNVKQESHKMWATAPTVKDSLDFLKKQLKAGMLPPLMH